MPTSPVTSLTSRCCLLLYPAAVCALFGAAFGQRVFLETPIASSIVPYVDSGLREMANVTFEFSIDPSAVTGARSIVYTASCAAEGVEPSCSPGSLTPQTSGSLDAVRLDEAQFVTVSNVPYANATGQYTCAINMTVESSQSTDGGCELVEIPPPPVHVRMNIEDVTTAAHDDYLNLLLLAMDEVQKRPADDPTGWFAIASIHGQNVSYNGTGQANNASDVFMGFCQHGSILFPTFHRGYQMHMEKALRHYAEEIARQYEDPELRALYVDVASRLRLPYWDWTSATTVRDGVPDVFLVERVPVTLPPSGKKTFIQNPLKKYRFVEGVANYPKGAWTSRHPSGFTGRSDDNLLNSNVRFAADVTLIPGVRSMFNITNYHAFSNHHSTTGALGTQNDSNYGYYPSVEVFHDGVHGIVGGLRGTMGFFSVAAFDPIFWFHHNNVERLFELWQMMNPDEWLEPSNVVQENTMSTVVNQTVDGSTPILPFRMPSGEYMTSDLVRDVRSFTSTYDDVREYMDGGLSPEEIKEAVVTNLLSSWDQGKTFRVNYAGKVNGAVDGAPSPGGRVHVFLLPEEQPSIETDRSSNPNYCGSVDLSTLDQGVQVSLDECMRGAGLNFYWNLDYDSPPWSQTDILDPTRRFGVPKFAWNTWATQPDSSFALVVEGPDGSDYSEYVTFGDPSVIVEYTYSSGEQEYKNVASANFGTVEASDGALSTTDPTTSSAVCSSPLTAVGVVMAMMMVSLKLTPVTSKSSIF